MGYADYQPLRVPGFLQGDNGAVVMGALGGEKDYQLDVCRQSLLASYPGLLALSSANLDQIGLDLATARTAGETDVAYEARLRTAAAGNPVKLVAIDRAGNPSANLDLIGADRRLPRAAGESDAVYSARLRVAWDDIAGHSYAGSRESLLLALLRAGFPGAYIIERTSIYYRLFGGPPVLDVFDGSVYGLDWAFDNSPPALWNQFGIIFNGPTLAPDGTTLAAGTAGALLLDKVVKTWKPAKACYMGAKVMDTGPFWNWPVVGATWDRPLRIWGSVGSGISVVYDIPPL